jgi:hypothetical protein
MGHVTVPYTSFALYTYNVLMEVLTTHVIDYSFFASSHTAGTTGSVDQSELRIHLFAPQSTINESVWTSCRMLFLVYPIGRATGGFICCFDTLWPLDSYLT